VTFSVLKFSTQKNWRDTVGDDR